MRDVGAGWGFKRYGRIHNGFVGAAALIDDGRLNERFERRSDLPQSLGGTIELGEIEVAAADHCLDLSGGIVECYQRAFRTRVQFEADLRFSARIEREHL